MAASLADINSAPDQNDLWAWQRWASTQDPSTYGWKGSGVAIDGTNLLALKPALVAAGKWNPQWDAILANPRGGGGSIEQGTAQEATFEGLDLSSLNGYELRNARTSGQAGLTALFDPSGQMVNGSGTAYTRGHQSLNGDDYAAMAAVLAAGYGSAALAGTTGGAAAAGGASTAGGAAGGTAGAVGSTTAEQIALMQANGLTAAEISAATGGQVAGYTAADVAAMQAAGGAAGTSLASAPSGAAPSSTAPTSTAPATTAPNSGSSGLSDFLKGNGKMGDYIQLGGLVASVAARPKSADTSGINDAARASASIAERQQTLAEKQYADQLALFNEYKPMLTQQLQNTIAEQAKSSARSDQQWQDYMNTWRPAEQSLAQKSQDWASPGRMQQAAQEAQAGVATQYDTNRQQQREQMIAAGLDPSTIATIQASQGALEAKDRAGAANTARRTVEQQGMAYLDNAARFGRNMPSTGLAAAGLAGSQGQQVQSGYTGLVNATAAPAATSNPLFSSAVSSNNSAGSLYGNVANINNQQNLQSYNQMMGTIAGLNQWYQSSKKTKKVHGKVKGAAAAVEKSGASRWSYKDGQGDGNTKERMGPMAEDLQAVAPSVSNGKVVDAISMAGLHHAAIGENTRALREQNKRLKRIESKLSLADA